MRRALASCALSWTLLAAGVAHAEGAEPRGVVADRVAVRFITPETGGSAQPRFMSERELAFFTRIEAHFEHTRLEPSEYPERYARAAIDRFVARSMLASLMIQRGVEPPHFSRLVGQARAELEARIGASTLAEAMREEGIEEEELLGYLRDEVRSAYWVDRVITPILAVREDALREAFRSMMHPFRGAKFDDVRAPLRRWLVVERLRAAELEFFQSARARVEIQTLLRAPAPAGEPARSATRR